MWGRKVKQQRVTFQSSGKYWSNAHDASMKPKKYPTNCMSPGTDFNMYQKVASNTKSNVFITSRQPKSRSQSSLDWFLLGDTEERSKTNAEKKRQQILHYKHKIPSNNAQTCTVPAKQKQTILGIGAGRGVAAKGKEDKRLLRIS